MPRYILAKHLPGNDYGEWSKGEEFDAADDEEAKRIAMEIIGRNRIYYGSDPRVRILKVVFDDSVSKSGYPLPRDEVYEKLEAEQTALITDTWVRLKTQTLNDYGRLHVVLQTVPEVPDGAGRDLRLFFAARKGFMGYASEEEVTHARDAAKLSPGDAIISAYYIAGIRGAQCVSFSKVLSFEADGETPKKLIHLWPLEFHNIAITPEYLKKNNVEIEDERD